MFNSIVVGTDGSPTAAQAVREAVDVAGAVGATLVLVSAYAPEQRPAAEALLDDAAKVAREAGIEVNLQPRQGDPADAIIDVAEEQNADLVIVGNKGMTGAKRFLLGSVPDKVSHHAPCSVMIVQTS